MNLGFATVCAALIAGSAFSQEPPVQDEPQELPAIVPDPAALEAFSALVKAYRERPALTVKSTVKIELSQNGVTSSGGEVKAEFIFGPDQSAVVKFKDFTSYLSNDTIWVTHEKNKDSYFSAPDEDSPYYALLTAFFDLPFPELALALGFDDVGDVLMQFHPKAAMVQPTSLATEERDGKTIQRLKLTSENEAIDVLIDPETKLIQSIDLKITGGDLVQPGATLVYKHSYEYQTHDKPLDEAVFTFDPGPRQRVDMVGDLRPPPAPHVAGANGEAGAQHPLVGQPAPPLVLATADGKAVDLQELRGKVVVLDFWATWCPPCRKGLPLLHDVARWASDEQLPVSVITVNVWEIRNPADDTPDARLESVKNFWEKRGFTLPIAMDYTDETAQAYGVPGIPMTVVIRSDGVVHAVPHAAPDQYVEELKTAIQGAIKAVEAPDQEPPPEEMPPGDH